MGIVLAYFIALAGALKFNRKMYEAIPSSMMMVSLILYLSTFAVGLEHAVFVVIAIVIFAIGYVVIRMIGNPGEVLELVKTRASLFLIFAFLFFGICSIGRGLQRGDDLTYWGYNIKYMYLFGRFQQGMIHGPSSILWCYFANKTWIGLSTGISMWAQNLLTFSLFFPLLRVAKNEKFRYMNGISVFLIALIFPLEFSDSTFSSLMPDVLLGLLVTYAVYILIQFLHQERFQIFDLFLSLYMITLLKRIGILFAAGIVFITAYLIQNRDDKADDSRLLRVLPIMEVIIIDALYLSWYRISNSAILFCLIPFIGMCAGYFLRQCVCLCSKHKKLVLLVVAGLMLIFAWIGGKPATDASASYFGMINRWYAKEIFTVDYSSLGNTPISLGQFLLICVTGLFIFRYLKIKKHTYDAQDRMFVCLEGLWVLFDIGYLSALFITYRETISEANINFGQYLPGLDRYLIPCYIPLILFLFYYLMRKFAEQLPYIALLEVTGTILFTDMSRLSEYVLFKYIQPEFYAAQEAGITMTEQDKIFYVDQTDDYEMTVWGKAFAYAMLPATCDYKNPMADLRTEDGLSPEEWENILINGYTYVYLQTINDDFATKYQTLFADKEKIAGGSIYQVTGKNGQVLLVNKAPKQ